MIDFIWVITAIIIAVRQDWDELVHYESSTSEHKRDCAYSPYDPEYVHDAKRWINGAMM